MHVAGMGSGLLDELGMLDGPQQALTPHHLDLLKWQSAISVATGASHNLALLADGSVIAWGFNDHGQLDTSPSFATSLAIPSLTTDPVARR